jgi:hypothetical protein
MMQEYRIDIAASTSERMATSLKLTLEPSPVTQALAFLRELRSERARPWIEIEMPNRRVTQ